MRHWRRARIETSGRIHNRQANAGCLATDTHNAAHALSTADCQLIIATTQPPTPNKVKGAPPSTKVQTASLGSKGVGQWEAKWQWTIYRRRLRCTRGWSPVAMSIEAVATEGSLRTCSADSFAAHSRKTCHIVVGETLEEVLGPHLGPILKGLSGHWPHLRPACRAALPWRQVVCAYHRLCEQPSAIGHLRAGLQEVLGDVVTADDKHTCLAVTVTRHLPFNEQGPIAEGPVAAALVLSHRKLRYT
jgi:hypothetical protein